MIIIFIFPREGPYNKCSLDIRNSLKDYIERQYIKLFPIQTCLAIQHGTVPFHSSTCLYCVALRLRFVIQTADLAHKSTARLPWLLEQTAALG